MFAARIARQATHPRQLSSIVVTSRPSHRLLTLQRASMSSQTISDALIKDHRELKEYYQEVISHPNDHDHQQRYANQFTWELARHSVGEELVVYPALESYVPDGRKWAEKDREEHHKVKEQLKVFQNMKASDPDFIPQIKAIWSNLEPHIEEEEGHDLPVLEKSLGHGRASTSEELATSFGRTKMFVPSRSHPSAGEHPPFETVMGLLTAPLDHITDLFRKFPNQTISPNPSTK